MMRRSGVMTALVALLVFAAAPASAPAAKAKKCKASGDIAYGVHTKGFKCGKARRFAVTYATTPSKKELATELSLRCRRRAIDGKDAFRVKCFGYGRRTGKLIRFKYRS